MSTNQPIFTPPSQMPQKLGGEPLVDDKAMITYMWLKHIQSLPKANQIPSSFVGTHVQRLKADPSTYPNGSTFFESDTELYYQAVGGKWFYLSGIQSAYQDSIPILTADDAGLILYVIDFAHSLQWNGTAFQWGPGDHGSGFIVAFVSAPSPLTGWQLCDGSVNVPTLNSDGTLSFATVPTIAANYYRQ